MDYWELYLAYIRHCEEFNKRNDIDPHHYEMEWNHLLPQCIFGEQPFGQWLTLKQHAIASALQTIAFRYRCMFGTHIKHLPDQLWELARPFYNEGSRLGARKTVEQKLGIFDPKNKEAVEATNIRNWTNEQRQEYGRKSSITKGPEVCSKIASLAAKVYWDNATDEEKETRNLKVSESSKTAWGQMDEEQRNIRLGPARKSLMKPVKVLTTDNKETIYNSLTEAAENLGVGRKTISRLVKHNLPHKKLNILRVVFLPGPVIEDQYLASR